MVLLFHKPFGVLCQFTPDQPGQRTLAEFDFPPIVYPLGRLDLDSEGLLLLGDEPGMNKKLLDPQFGHERTYWAQIEGAPQPRALESLRAGGMAIQGHRCLPCRAQIIAAPALPERDPPVRFRKTVPTAWLELVLTEGKNRQVRRMTAAIGHPTLRLFRAAIGNLRWKGEKPGEWRELSPQEIRSVFHKS